MQLKNAKQAGMLYKEYLTLNEKLATVRKMPRCKVVTVFVPVIDASVDKIDVPPSVVQGAMEAYIKEQISNVEKEIEML